MSANEQAVVVATGPRRATAAARAVEARRAAGPTAGTRPRIPPCAPFHRTVEPALGVLR
ncbi:hypothetical protein [Streptomyces sp. NPDC048521]|uniref:hypothetical protein n=1 Tax=Streptomyces sp. NPDC048521 TaxID=3365566 RepID=UPI00371CCCC1